MRRYRKILRRRGTAAPFAASVVARLAVSMGPLGMVLLVQQVTGSYTVAGLSAGAWALAVAVATPLWGRGVDRYGPARIVAPAAVASGSLLAVFALAAGGSAPAALLLPLATASGATFPPVSPAMRAAWRRLLGDEAERQAGFALDAVAMEVIFVSGPLLLSVLLVTAPAQVPLLVTAGLLAGGGVWFSATGVARAWRPMAAVTAVTTVTAMTVTAVAAQEPGESGGAAVREGSPADAIHHRSPLRSPGLPAVLLVMLAMAVGFGQADVAIAATARETLQDQGKVGLLFAAIAGGSVCGGLWYGARHWPGSQRRRLPVLLAWFSTGLGVLAVLLATAERLQLWVVLVVLAVTGASIAPVLIIAANLIDLLAPAGRRSEAQGWLTTAFTSGGAGGTAFAGVLVDAGGPQLAFLGAATALAGSAVLAGLGQRRWRSADQLATPPAPHTTHDSTDPHGSTDPYVPTSAGSVVGNETK